MGLVDPSVWGPLKGSLVVRKRRGKFSLSDRHLRSSKKGKKIPFKLWFYQTMIDIFIKVIARGNFWKYYLIVIATASGYNSCRHTQLMILLVQHCLLIPNIQMRKHECNGSKNLKTLIDWSQFAINIHDFLWSKR